MLMLSCRQCRAELREEAKYCTRCGKKQEIMQSPVMSPSLFSGTPTKLRERAEVPWELFNHVEQGDETVVYSRRNNAGLGNAWPDGQEVLFLSGQEQQRQEITLHERLLPPL